MIMNRIVAFIKRITDIVLSITGLTLALPVFIIIPPLIKSGSKGPVFFIQERIGLDEKKINVIKFRTMYDKVSSDWTKKSDPRITHIGHFLRLTRIDEIPQFFNVIRGEMTVIGPRPEQPHYVEKLKIKYPYYFERMRGVKPGITGLAQINAGYDSSIEGVETKLLYDFSYAACLTRLQSYLAMEISIIARTIVVMITGKGAN